MSAKTVFCSALLVTLLGSAAVSAQTPNSPGQSQFGQQTPYTPNNPLVEPLASDEEVRSRPTVEPPGHLSDWILGSRSACCFGPTGDDGPIKKEIFTRAGLSVPFGQGVLARSLQPGFALEGGVRTLLFEPGCTRAWTLELSLLSIWQHANRGDLAVPLNILVPNATGTGTAVNLGQGGLPGATVRNLNRTFVSFGGGREWYLLGAAGSGHTNWRVGFDVGGRWGTSNAEFNEIKHRTDVIGGTWAAVHTDVEVPCGYCTWLYGFRAEWDYTWSDILQHQNRADVMDINLLFNFGVRF